MFRQVKSALFWYYIYKFRRRIALILTLLLLLLLSEYIYSDVVEYLKIRNKTEWLDLILPMKWIIIFATIFFIFYLLLTIFNPPEEEGEAKREGKGEGRGERKPKKMALPVDNGRKKEKRGLSKREIDSLARELIAEKRRKKGRR
ncbi:MAG: hypothetical protein GXO19_02140 [Epsilonproteobacteria bacterium]|nr:hypothetical protein [Campylobacterota bacterium]NPA56517.1 hypothetical protein [Campylobacterota bacterium]